MAPCLVKKKVISFPGNYECVKMVSSIILKPAFVDWH